MAIHLLYTINGPSGRPDPSGLFCFESMIRRMTSPNSSTPKYMAMGHGVKWFAIEGV